MSRDIEFRAYDYDSRCMRYPKHRQTITSCCGVIEVLESVPVAGGLYKTILSKSFNGKLLQYTGLKDKNGNKIYEGDIIKMNEGYCFQGDEIIDAVVYEGGMFRTKQDRSDGHYCIGDGYRGGECLIEVIGNIHENPDLLSETTNA